MSKYISQYADASTLIGSDQFLLQRGTLYYKTTFAQLVTDLDIANLWSTNGNALSATGLFGSSTNQSIDFISNNVSVFSYDQNGIVVKDEKPIEFTDSGSNTVAISAPTTINTSYDLFLPIAQGVANTYLKNDGSGNLSWATVSSGGGGGGGSGISYYLNGSISQGTFGGNTYYEINKTAIIGAGTDFTITADGYIAQFITDTNDPGLLNIPVGNWNCNFYFSASSAGGSPSFYVEIYKYNGTTFTLIADSSATPEAITGGTAIDLYTTTVAVPSTTLAATDRIAIRLYVTHSGRTITLHTEDNHLGQVITTFSTGITALNGLTAQVQTFATGTSGTDFNIASATNTHTFNLPIASATNTGKLSNTDYANFKASSNLFSYYNFI